MSDVRDYLVEVVNPTRTAGDSRRVRAKTPEGAEKAARRKFAPEFKDGTYKVKEVPA